MNYLVETWADLTKIKTNCTYYIICLSPVWLVYKTSREKMHYFNDLIWVSNFTQLQSIMSILYVPIIAHQPGRLFPRLTRALFQGSYTGLIHDLIWVNNLTQLQSIMSILYVAGWMRCRPIDEVDETYKTFRSRVFLMMMTYNCFRSTE